MGDYEAFERRRNRFDSLYWNYRNHMGMLAVMGAAALAHGCGPRMQTQFNGRYVTPEEKARRRRANEIAKASRRRNRQAA